jgi:hypothetical protein
MIQLRHTQSHSADHVIEVIGSNPALAISFGRIFQIPAQLGGINLSYNFCWLLLTVLYLSMFIFAPPYLYGR